MSYTTIDPVISAWAARHNLTVYTQYQDAEVRSVDVISSKGRKYQIWIDPPKGTTVSVHAWDYKRQRRDWNRSSDQLAQTLEEAIQTVKSWMS